MRNRLLQLVVLMAFAATALPGSVGLHWLLGHEHQHHRHQSPSVTKETAKVHKHAGCKHHHHHVADEPQPTELPSHPSDDCSICDFYSQPLSEVVTIFEVSVELAPVAAPLAVEAVASSDSLVAPPARGPPSLV